jgi:replicative DNA helicase
MSVGKQLLFSVLTAEPSASRVDCISRLSDAGVHPEMFPNEDERRAFAFMLGHRVRYGVCPSLALVEVETEIRFPQYASQNPFDFWFDEFRNYVKHTSLIELITQTESLLFDGRVNAALDRIGSEYVRLRDLMTECRSSETLAELGEEALERHHLLQIGAMHEGVFTGFPSLDTVTGGVQPGDVWVIAGESSSGKTFVLCRCALSAVQSGKKVLMVNMEMPNRQVGRRSIAIGAAVSSSNFRLGRLSQFAVDQVRNFLRSWDDDRNSRFVLVEGRVQYSVRDMKAKIMEVRPDVVLIDGAYMLRAGGGSRARWEMNMEVLETLKQIAMEENIGMVSTFQFDQKQRTKSLATIMGGQAVGQLASVVIGIENEDSAPAYGAVTYKELTLYKGREGERGKIRLRYDMNRTIIEQDSVISGSSEFFGQDRDATYGYDRESGGIL